MEKLTKTEERIMQIMWKLQRGLVHDVIEKLGSPAPKYTTISSIMRILVDKGFLDYKAYGRTHEYFPLVSKTDYRKFIFKEMFSAYFENSPEQLVSFLVKEEDLNEEALDEIRELLNTKDDDNHE